MKCNGCKKNELPPSKRLDKRGRPFQFCSYCRKQRREASGKQYREANRYCEASRSSKRILDKNYQKKRRKNHPGLKTEESALYRKKYPEKVKAQQLFNGAVRSGKIIRSACVICGGTQKVHGHHPDYSKPLKIIWVCPVHHKLIHPD